MKKSLIKKILSKKVFIPTIIIIIVFTIGFILWDRTRLPTISCNQIQKDFEKIFWIPFIQNPNSIWFLKSGKHEGDLYCDIGANLNTSDISSINNNVESYLKKNQRILSHVTTWLLESSNTYYKKYNILANIIILRNDYELCINRELWECAKNLDKNKLTYQISVSLKKYSQAVVYFVD